MRFSHAPQQRKVLHVARADLNHVAVTLDQIDCGLIDCLGNDLEAVSFANLRQNFQSFFSETLKGIRRSAWLERAAAKESCAAASHSFSYCESLSMTLNCAGPG